MDIMAAAGTGYPSGTPSGSRVIFC